MKKRGDNNSGVDDIEARLAEYAGHMKTRRYSVNTVEVYEKGIRDFGAFAAKLGRKSVVEIDAEDLDKYRLSMIERGFRDSSVSVYLRSVRRFFAWLEEEQHIFVNPAANQPMFKCAIAPAPVPTQEEMHVLLSQPDTGTRQGLRDRAILEVAYSTGLRRRELASLTLDSVNLEDRTVRVIGKGNKERVVPLGKEPARWLRKYLRESRPQYLNGGKSDALWLGAGGGRLGHMGMQCMLGQYREAEGIKTVITLHAIRRACASHMVANGAHPVTIQMLLGHETLRHLGNYLRICDVDMKAMHEKSRLGQ